VENMQESVRLATGGPNKKMQN